MNVHFLLGRLLGRMLRAGRYSTVLMGGDDGVPHVRKYRRFYAPLLVRLGEPLVQLLDTGVRVLPRRAWQERERQLWQSLHGVTIRIDGDGVLVLPRLPGRTLAALLEDPQLEASARMRAVSLAVVALREFHRRGFTHGDAMAENVMIDLDADVARWFDFETLHDPERPIAWRRADDVRALLATCVLRTASSEVGVTVQLILDVYADEDVTGLLATAFTSAFRRPLAFHLGQANLTLAQYREIGRLVRGRARL